MPIPESQLETWSHQGSVTQCANTYQTIRKALLANDSGYTDQLYEIFLQGSYSNDTNIYAESDVDIVIRLDSIFRYHLDDLTPEEQRAYRASVTPATYSFDAFKQAVLENLKRQFGAGAVSVGSKALKIQPDNNRRSADVVVCYEYRRFKSFRVNFPNDYVSGIIIPTPVGEIVNYPKQHSENLTSQHQATGQMLKPMVRILKNLRSRLIDTGALGENVAPSYYVENMLFNVPTGKYVSSSYGDTLCNVINWLRETESSKLVCANYQYWLLGNSHVQWNATDFGAFLGAVCKCWNEWQ